MGQDRESKGQIDVLLIVEQDRFRAELRLTIESEEVHVVAEARTVEQALPLVARLSPEVVLMELGLAGRRSTLLRRILDVAPCTRVMVLAAELDADEVLDALAAGASGYLAADECVKPFAAGMVRAAVPGQPLVSARTTRALVERLRKLRADGAHADGVHARLSPRELEVLALIADGKDNGEIADALFISSETVKHHVSAILRKLGVQNRVQAAVLSLRRGADYSHSSSERQRHQHAPK